MVGWKPMSDFERRELVSSINKNAMEGTAIFMDRKTTEFRKNEDIGDEEVVSAIRSIPCHY
jgi:hypothetical protein